MADEREIPSSTEPSGSPDEIALADVEATAAEYRVGRCAVEIEVGQREMHEVMLALEVHLLAAHGETDVAGFRTVDVFRAEPLHEGHGLVDPRLEFGEGGLVVGIFRDFRAGEPGRGSLGEVGRAGIRNPVSVRQEGI